MRLRVGVVRSASMSTSAVDLVFVTAGVRFAYLFGSRATGCHRRRAGGAAPWSRQLRNRLDAFATSLARLVT
ncbi:MAG: hypothetical protein DLM61_25440 [Pseudonocardiales bacterium]|nr:MAG: hypothetical protein DLM61_25440 [Pseudonocardiales bacterium]